MNMKDYLQFLKLENELHNTCEKFMALYFPDYYDWSIVNVVADTETVFIAIENVEHACMSSYAEVPTPILLDESLWDVWMKTNPYH